MFDRAEEQSLRINAAAEVEQLISSIAAAIEEQSAVTKDAAGSIARA